MSGLQGAFPATGATRERWVVEPALRRLLTLRLILVLTELRVVPRWVRYALPNAASVPVPVLPILPLLVRFPVARRDLVAGPLHQLVATGKRDTLLSLEVPHAGIRGVNGKTCGVPLVVLRLDLLALVLGDCRCASGTLRANLREGADAQHEDKCDLHLRCRVESREI